MKRRRNPLLAALLALVFVVGGCAATSAPPLPEGVTVSVGQNRTDYADRRLEVTVDNATRTDIEVLGVRFASGQYTEDAIWQKDRTTVRAGATAALPVLLADPVCDVARPDPVVEITLQQPERDAVTVSVVPDDPLDRLPALHTEDCRRTSVEQVARITAVTPPRTVALGDVAAAELDLTIEPTGVDGSFTIDSAIGTTLFAVADAGTGAIIPELLVGATVHGDDDPSTLTLTLVPNRCDLHAVAEDKRGTILPLRVTVADGAGASSSGILSIASTDGVKSALLDYLATACG